MIYIIFFVASCFLIWIGEKTKDTWARFSLFFIAIILVALLAGIRDDTVGVDMKVYGMPIFTSALNSASFEQLQSRWSTKWSEPGYLFFNYIVSRFGVAPVFFFLLSFLQIAFVFVGLYHWRKKIPIWLAMFCFYCFSYNHTLNMMRQGLALSIVFYGTTFLFSNKYARFYVCIFIAMLFHYSVVLAMGFHLFYVIEIHFKSNKIRVAMVGIIIIIFYFSLDILTSLSPILNLIMGLVSSLDINYYAGYLDGEYGKMNPKIFFFLIPVFIFAIYSKRLFRLHSANYFLYSMTIFIALSTQLTLLGGQYSSRIGELFLWFIFLVIPQFAVVCRKKYRPLMRLSIVIYSLSYWYFYYVLREYDGTIPYASKYLDWI
jgi:hypothetical protein